jgi:hypothetical protein
LIVMGAVRLMWRGRANPPGKPVTFADILGSARAKEVWAELIGSKPVLGRRMFASSGFIASVGTNRVRSRHNTRRRGNSMLKEGFSCAVARIVNARSATLRT